MIKAGDVFSIPTSKGEAYFQYVRKNPLMGSLIRVLPGVFESQPEDMGGLVNNKTNFWIFFPVSGALKLQIIKKVGKFDVPEHSSEMPLFRAGNASSEKKKSKTGGYGMGSESGWLVTFLKSSGSFRFDRYGMTPCLSEESSRGGCRSEIAPSWWLEAACLRRALRRESDDPGFSDCRFP